MSETGLMEAHLPDYRRKQRKFWQGKIALIIPATLSGHVKIISICALLKMLYLLQVVVQRLPQWKK